MVFFKFLNRAPCILSEADSLGFSTGSAAVGNKR